MERFFVNQVNNNSVVVGGVRKLVEFDRSRVAVAVAGAQVVISGDGLKIARFDENEICIEGKIAGVETTANSKNKNPSLRQRSTEVASRGDAKNNNGNSPL